MRSFLAHMAFIEARWVVDSFSMRFFPQSLCATVKTNVIFQLLKTTLICYHVALESRRISGFAILSRLCSCWYWNEHKCRFPFSFNVANDFVRRKLHPLTSSQIWSAKGQRAKPTGKGRSSNSFSQRSFKIVSFLFFSSFSVKISGR